MSAKLPDLLNDLQVLRYQLCCNGLVNEGKAGDLNAPTNQKEHLLHLLALRPIGLNVVAMTKTLKQHALGALLGQLMVAQLLLQFLNRELVDGCGIFIFSVAR